MQKCHFMRSPFDVRCIVVLVAMSLSAAACGAAEEPSDISDDDIEATSVSVGRVYKLADGRLGTVSSVAGDTASVSVYDKASKRLVVERVTKSDLKGYAAFNAALPKTTLHASRRPAVASFFANSGSDYPQLVGQMAKLEVVWKGVDWMDYNCVANSVRKTTWDEPKSTMEAQDAYYAAYGLRPVASGRITMAHLGPQKGIEKVLIYALSSNPGHPRHAVVQDVDGLWNSKMGQGPHIRLADAEALVGADAGVPMRLYARVR